MGDAFDDFLDSRLGWEDEDDLEDEGSPVTRFFTRSEEKPGYEVGRCRVTTIYEKAIRVEILDGPHAGDSDNCFPKSQIHTSSEVNDGTLIDEEGTLVISAWLAGKRGWKA
jgi:hypothetical protein